MHAPRRDGERALELSEELTRSVADLDASFRALAS